MICKFVFILAILAFFKEYFMNLDVRYSKNKGTLIGENHQRFKGGQWTGEPDEKVKNGLSGRAMVFCG